MRRIQRWTLQKVIFQGIVHLAARQAVRQRFQRCVRQDGGYPGLEVAAPARLGIKLSIASITPMVKRLEQAGFLTRCRDVKDERRVLVDLTPAGNALRDDVAAVPDNIQSACRITDTDADVLRTTLERIGRFDDSQNPDSDIDA